jgi:hypothetical protein
MRKSWTQILDNKHISPRHVRNKWILNQTWWLTNMQSDNVNDNDNYNDKPIKSLLKGKGLLPPVGLARLDSEGELPPMSCIFSIFSVSVRPIIWFEIKSNMQSVHTKSVKI